MTTAAEKNQQAFANLLGSAALASHLFNCRIAVHSDDGSNTPAGRLLAAALGDVLGRLWPQIDATGPLASALLPSATISAASANLPASIQERWSPPYDAVIAIASVPAGDAGPVVRIGADGWMVSAGRLARVGESLIPVGPAAAAALASAELFKHVFKSTLAERANTWLEDFEWNVWNFGASANEPAVQELNIRHAHVFGVGAVTHGLLWVLERWPKPVTGELLLIDGDGYDVSNGQRYAGMRPGDEGCLKVDRKAERLREIHSGLTVHPFPHSMNEYFDRFEPTPRVSLAVVGLDSGESRRQVALKLPRRAVNMWTDSDHLGSARHGGGDGWPCLMCAYPEVLHGLRDEPAVLAPQTGMEPARIRHLLDTGERLSQADAALVAARSGLAVELVSGKPLRSVLQQLCATGKLALPGAQNDVDVPFAFSSLLAGVAGFSNLAAELWGCETSPFRWTYNILKRPNPGLIEPAGPKANCALCADETYQRLVARPVAA